METTEFAAFQRATTEWPISEFALESVAGHFSALIGAPLVGIQVLFPIERIAVKLLAPDLTGGASEPMKAFIKKQVGAPDPEARLIRHIQLNLENAPWASSVGVAHLAIAPMIGESHGDVGMKETRHARVCGALIVGSPKILSTREELLLIAATQRLTELMEINELEEKLKMRSQFLSIASHELKTPLTSIYGMLQLQERMLRLKNSEPIEEQQEKQLSFLKIVIRQVQRLNELIDGLLDVSRIQNGRFTVNPEDTNIATMLREMVSSRLGGIAREAGVVLSLDSPADIHAWVDPVRMEEVITNLVMNAIRFSPEGGSVWIRASDEVGTLRLIVRDQGPGVPLEDRERIFQPFERAQRTGRLGGLGLGLFISRQIAQLHGGNVNLVESLPGKGNVFEATFPMRGASLASSA